MNLRKASTPEQSLGLGNMALRWFVVVMVTAFAACTPSPEQLQPANPLAGASGVVVHLGGCSPATSPCE
jgi:hypothetical protein